jgi:hypothetical protein
VVDIIELVREFVLTYTSPSPCVVEVSERVLIYPEFPRPATVETTEPAVVLILEI